MNELTDEQIEAIYDEVKGKGWSVDFARAIIAADRELQPKQVLENLDDLPPIGKHDHPDCHTMAWTESEIRAIKAYAAAAIAQQASRHAEELAAYALTVSNLRAQREQGEPAAWGMPGACGNIVEVVTADDVGQTGELKAWRAQYSVPLYTAAPAPEPERKPMTELQVKELMQKVKVPVSDWDGYVDGIWAAEAFHGIGEKP